MNTIAQKFKHRAILDKVMPTSFWNKKRTDDITDNGAVLKTTEAVDPSVFV